MPPGEHQHSCGKLEFLYVNFSFLVCLGNIRTHVLSRMASKTIAVYLSVCSLLLHYSVNCENKIRTMMSILNYQM